MHTRPTHRTRRLAVAAATAVATLLLAPAGAQAQSSPYYIGVAQSLSHESNIYRIGNDQALPAGLDKSDTVSGTSLVAGVDQTWGRQRLYGSGNLRANRYSSNKSLDNASYGLNMAVDWATVNRLSGTVALAADKSLAQFNNRTTSGVDTVKNEARTLSLEARARLGVVTRYTLEAGAGWRQRKYSADSYDRLENTQQYGSIGVRLRPSNLLNLGAALRLTNTDYPRWRLLGTGGSEPEQIRRQDIDFTASWQPSGASQINARLSPTRSRYDRNPDADFSGLTGSASWAWQYTGKTKLTTTLSRDTGQSADAIAQGIFSDGQLVGIANGITDESRTTTALGLRAQHELTGKIALTGGLTYARRALRSDQVIGGAAQVVATGNDTTSILSLGGRWSPTRNIQVGCDASVEKRSSSNQQLSVALGSNSLSCYGQFVLQ